MSATPVSPPAPASFPVPEGSPDPRAMSTATRLMSAGAYLERSFRSTVVRELVHFRFRVVPPSYGYDAVTVLAHALAARRLWRQQLWTTLLGAVLLYFLVGTGVIRLLTAFLLVIWLAGSTAFLRRVATLQILISDLRPGKAGAGGAYPLTPALTPELVDRISRQQSVDTGLVRYSGFRPFVGSGILTDSWAYAELVKPAQPDPVRDALDRTRDHAVIPFTVGELTGHVEKRMRTVLRDGAAAEESIKDLVVERRRYQQSVTLAKEERRWFRKTLWLADELPEAPVPGDGTHWQETHDAAREYLSIRVGAWDQELVTTMYVGFDLRGDTLHIEFHTYVLPPIRRSFHLIDRLPERLEVATVLRVAWDVLRKAPFSLLAAPARLLSALGELGRRGIRASAGPQTPDISELQLGRYALASAERGARTSVREIAAENGYQNFFQASDKVKYMKIVEAQLVESIELFLIEHNVDLADHRAARANIMNGDVNTNYGTAARIGRDVAAPRNQSRTEK